MQNFKLVAILACFYASDVALAMPANHLLKGKWSEECATKQGVETSEYSVFSKDNWCTYFVDTFRVQQNCEDATFEPLGANRLSMQTRPKNKYIIEFLWASKISIMKVVKEKPFILEQVMTLGRAETRKGLLTHHLYCP